MKLPIVDENSVKAHDVPGRSLRWVVTKENTNAQQCSMCVIEVHPGQAVRPAHSHPNGEEVIYILNGTGRVMIDGVVEPVRGGCAVLFPQGSIHMLQNTGADKMKVACFFAPPANFSNYKYFEDIQFPD